MNLQQLLPMLRNGYSYSTEDGLIHRPPNKYMLEAARNIQELVDGIEQRNIVIQSLHNQVQGLLNDLQAAQTVQKANSAEHPRERPADDSQSADSSV